MISKESIQKELEEIFDSFSKDDLKKVYEYFYGKSYQTFPEIDSSDLREGQKFSYILSKIVSVKVAHSNLFYCSDSELVSECLQEFFDKLISIQ